MSQLPAELHEYLDTLGCRVAGSLKGNLVGTYLHGSAVLGGFNPARSDVDVLVAVNHGLSDHDRQRVEAQLNPISLPVPATTLEMSIITLETSRLPVAAPPYEMHVNTRNGRYSSGEGKTDPDLVLHFAIARQAGRVIGTGRHPQEVFAPVLRELVLTGMALELDDAVTSQEAAAEYIVLNACRNLAYLRNGRFCSKIDGGQWVLDHDEEIDPAVVSAALSRQDGRDPSAPIDITAVRSTARAVVRALRSEAG